MELKKIKLVVLEKGAIVKERALLGDTLPVIAVKPGQSIKIVGAGQSPLKLKTIAAVHDLEVYAEDGTPLAVLQNFLTPGQDATLVGEVQGKDYFYGPTQGSDGEYSLLVETDATQVAVSLGTGFSATQLSLGLAGLALLGAVGGSSAPAPVPNRKPTGTVTIDGKPSVGQTLSVREDLQDADGLGKKSYQWYADGKAIDGATGTSLSLDSSLAGKAISVKVSYTDGRSVAESVASASTAVVDTPSSPSGDLSKSVLGDTAQATGKINLNDPDATPAKVVASEVTGQYGTFKIDDSGNWTFTPDANKTAPLAQDAVGSEYFAVYTTDGNKFQVKIDVVGKNDVPVISGTASASIDQNTAKVTDTLSIVDVDSGQSKFNAIGSYQTAHGTFTVTETGTWSFTQDLTKSKSLGATETATDTVRVYSADGSAFQDVSVTIQGTNDVASIQGSTSGTTAKDSTAPVGGSLTVTDPDTGEAKLLETGSIEGKYGTFTLTDGTWSYLVDKARAAELGQGSSFDEKLVVHSKDGTSSAEIVVSVQGKNTIANLSGDLTGASDRTQQVSSGKITVVDLDLGENMVQPLTNVGGLYGTFSITADGAWTYTLDTAKSTALGTTPVEETFNVYSEDGTAQVTVKVAVSDINDPSGLSGNVTQAITEDTSTLVTGVVYNTDPDVAQAGFLPAQNLSGTYGTFTFNAATGAYTYQLDTRTTQSLPAGTRVQDKLTVLTADGATHDIHIEIAGVNDPTVFGEPTNVSFPSAGVVKGKLTFTDVDSGEAKLIPISGSETAYGKLTVDEFGAFQYVAKFNDAAYKALPAGQTVEDLYPVLSMDGTEYPLSFLLAGINDPASISGSSTGMVSEDAANNVVGGKLTVTDPDTGEALFKTVDAGLLNKTYGTFNVGTEGNWSYTLDNSRAATQALTGTQVVTESLVLTAKDGTASITISVRVQGADEPVAGLLKLSDVLTAPEAPSDFTTGTPLATFVETHNMLNSYETYVAPMFIS